MYFVSSPKTCKNLNFKHINSYVKLSDHHHTMLKTYNVSTKSVAFFNEDKNVPGTNSFKITAHE